MEKTATLNLRVNPKVKERAEAVLSRLGVPMSTAIDMYLNQISLTGSIPFSISLPKKILSSGTPNTFAIAAAGDTLTLPKFCSQALYVCSDTPSRFAVSS